MKNTIVKLGFCLVFICAAQAALAAPPTVVVSRIGGTPTNAASVDFNVHFDQSVTGFGEAADYNITGTGSAGATASLQSGSGQDYVVRVTGYTVNGTVTLEIKAGAAVNGGAEANVVSTGGVPTFTFDNDKPDVTINKKGSQNDPTGTSPVLFTLTFNEAINATTLIAADIDLSTSTTGASTLTVTNITEVTPTLVYEVEVTVSGSAVAGNIIATLPLDKVNDQAGNGNTVSTSSDNSVAWVTKPVLGPPTVGARTATGPAVATAVLGGEVLDDGGATVTSRGTVWDFAPGVDIGDHFSDTGYGTGEGVFSNTRMANLTAQTLIYFRSFATNAAGTTLSTESSFYTVSTVPGADRDVTATAASPTRIDLSFTDFSGITPCDGMVILRKTGSAILDTDVVIGVAPEDQPLFLYDVDDNSETTYADLTVTAGTRYYYAVVPYNYDATNDIDETHNYRLGFNNDDEWSFNKSSVIELDDPASAQLAYASKQAATIANTSDGLEVMRLDLHDGGLAHNDNDGRKTILNTLVVDITNSSMLRRVALFKGSTLIQEKAAASQVTFNVTSGSLEANNNNNQEFQIYASFQNTGIVDGTVIQFTINSATVHPGSSEFAFADARAGASAATTGTTNNAINVIATVYEIVGPAGTVVPGGAFGFTATLKDGNGFVDTNIGGNVTLTLQTGDGTLGPAPNLTAAITSGVATFSGLILSEAGSKEIRLHSTNGGPSDFDLAVNVQSLGVSLTGPVAQEFCFNDASTTASTFTTLNNIVILESSKTDFGVGTNQTLYLALPTGFIFDVTVPPTLGEIGNEVTNLVALPYVNNYTVRFKYDVTGNSNVVKDQITISGLKVKYTGTTAVTAQKIIRVGGTAIQEKNTGDEESPPGTANPRSHGTLSSVNGATVVDFINTNGGGISATETNFSKNSSTPIVLQGKRSSDNASINGVFSGPGITLDGDGKYKFVANSLATGVYDITFVYTDPVAPNCKSSVTKQFTVYTSIVNGLNTEYCVDDTPSTLLGPTSFNPGGYCYDSFLGLIYFNPTRFTYPASNQFVWYNPVNGTYNIIGPVNNQFNPSAPEYQAAINQYGYIYVGYRAADACNPGFDAYFVDFVRIYKKPTLNFSPTMSTGICSTDDAVSLVGTFFDKDGTFDEFWSSAVSLPNTPANGVTGDRTAGFDFDPDLANPTGAADIQVQINYKHLNDTTGCSNQVSKVINVWRKPPPVPAGVISIRSAPGDTSGEFCQELDPPTPFSATNVAGKWYKWYDATSTNQVTAEGSFVFSPTAYLPNTAGTLDIATTTFNITQSERRQTLGALVLFNGCESNPLPLTVQIFAPTTISAGSTTTICEGNPVNLQGLGAFITPPSGTLNGTWASMHPTDPGTFGTGDRFNGGTPATTYFPSLVERAEGLVTLRLRSDNPPGPCGAVESFVSIRINPGTTVTFPVPIVEYCATTTAMTVEGTVSTPALGFTWTVTDGDGTIDPADDNKTVTTYQPSITELNEGGIIELTLTTDDPDGGSGPCDVVENTMEIHISQRPRVVAGPDYEICVDQPINLTSRIPPTGNPLGDITKSSATSVTWSTANGLGTIVSPGSLNTTYTPFNPDEVENTKAITFTVTSNTPGGANVCPPESDDVTITIHPRPGAPTPINPPNYCVGDIVDLLRVGGTYPTWYNNPDLLPAHVIIAGNNALSTSVVANAEKQVPFYVTQTTDKTATFAGCESVAVTMTVVVNPLPVPNFTYANQCLGEIMQFTDGSTLAQPSSGSRSIVSWQWNFDDGLGFTDASAGPIPAGTQDGRTTGTFKDPGHQFKNTGLYNVRLALVTSDGCTASTVKNGVKVGQIPEAKFISRLVCDQDDTEFKFDGAAPEAGTTYSYAWDFNDPASGSDNASTLKDPHHKFSGVNTYGVSLTVTTDLNCESSVTIPTSILPYIKNAFPYIEAFETPNHGWVSQGFPETSWNLSTGTNHIQAPAFPAGSTFWVTNKNVSGQMTYTNGERSVLYGPCVDMTDLDRPVLAMDYWSDTEGKGDGAYIEVMDESAANPVWVRLGDTNSGLNWYNESSIGGLAKIGTVGQELSQFGWSGESDGWKTARYNLDNFTNNTRLRFRIVFGSNGSQPLDLAEPFDGFALDYFKLETRNRLVLVENFTTRSTSSVVTNNTAAFKAFPSAAASSEVVKIEYHTGLPAAAGDPVDEIFQQNPMDPNARASFYGLSAVPRGYIDGYTNTTGAGLFSLSPTNWATTYYSTESLVTSPLDIVIATPTITNGVITITGTVTAKEFDLKANAYSIYVAVVEETVGSDSYVLRKMLPSASGRKVPATPRNGSFTFTESWSIDRAYLTADPKLIAVAFVQADIATPGTLKRDVLQAALNDDIPTFQFTTGIEVPILEQTALYPNPADRLVNIELPDPTKTGVEVNVIDGMGRAVIKSSIGIGERKTTIDTGGLAGAVYIIQLRENGVFTNRRLLVTHKH